MAEMDDEAAWILKSRQGDHEAFAGLVKCHQRMIHALTFRMTGSLADSEDLAQETFIQAFRQLGTYRAEARFLPGFIALPSICASIGATGGIGATGCMLNGSSIRKLPPTPDSRRLQQVQEALLKLNPKQRAAVVLTTYEGLNHAEAARVLNCSESTVSWRLFTARVKLKKLLADVQTKEPHREEL